MVSFRTVIRVLAVMEVLAGGFLSVSALPTAEVAAAHQNHYAAQTPYGRRALQTDGCQTIPITVQATMRNKRQSELTLLSSLCLCIQEGVLTKDSMLDLEAAVVNAERIRPALAFYGSEELVLEAAVNDARRELGVSALPCGYPKNMVPSCPNHATMSYAYDVNERECYASECVAGTKGCNKQIPAAEANVEAKPVRRAAIPKQLCPPGLSACEVSGISLQDGRSPRSLSCIDTQNDVEACGGCPFPGSDAPQGEDCTMMDGVDEVICRLGGCEAVSCMRGFKLKGRECISDNNTPFWKRAGYA